MPSTWTRARGAVLIAVGMMLLLAGVVAGAAAGTLLAPGPEVHPLLIGETNSAGSSPTSVTANTGSRGTTFLVEQQGTGTALRGVAGIGIGGYFTSATGTAVSGVVANADSYSIYAANDAATNGRGAAIRADGRQNAGIRATSSRTSAVVGQATGCSGDQGDAPWACAGGEFTGTAGVTGTSSSGTFGIGVVGSAGDGANWGVWSDGPAYVDGDLQVTGFCTGCTAATIAVAAEPLQQGDAVTLAGVADIGGRTVLQVQKAKKSDSVIGIADRAVDMSAPQVRGAYMPGETSVDAGAALRVITGGVVTFAAADASAGAIAIGDALAASDAPGKLAKGSGTPGTSIGFAAGLLEDGRVAVYIAAH